jgi:type I restriction enzyme S subunit
MSKNSDVTIALLEKHFDIAFAAPDGIKKLREFILSLAMQGKLVPQDPNAQPASELLKEIEAEKERLINEGKIKKSKPLLEVTPDEVAYDLPRSWEWVTLEQVVLKIGSGSTPRGGKEAYEIEGIPFLRSQNIWNNEIKLDDVAFISEETHRKMMATKVRPMDILLNITGASLGRCAIVPDDFEEANVSQHVTIVRCVNPEIRRFIHCLLLSPYGQSMIWSRQVGMSREGLSKKVLEQFQIPLPPLAEQRRIIAKIDELMARCDELEKLRGDRDRKQITVHTATLDRLLIAKEQSDFNTAWQFITQHFSELYSVKENVTELRKAILQLAVMGKLVPQDPKDQPASELLEEIEAQKKMLVKEGKIKPQKPLPKITLEEIPYVLPTKWMWVRMDDLCPGITSGSTPPNHIFSDKEGIPFLKVYNIRNQKIDFQYKPQFIDEEYHFKSKRSCLKPGDVIMNIVGPPLGKVAIIPDDFPEYNCNQAIVFFRPIVSSLNKYLYLYLLSGKFLDKIELIGTAGQDNISVTKSRSILIPLPPLAEQHRIVAKIDQLMALCYNLEKQIDAANSKQTNLLNAVMTKI